MKNGPKSGAVGGLPANKVVVPIVLVMAFLHVTIISFIMMINSSSARLSSIMQQSADYMNDATSLLAGSSLMSETSGNFILMPLTETGEVNVHPLAAYARELPMARRGNDVMARFQQYQVSAEALSYLSAAAKSADVMMEIQLHAIALVSAVYPLPDVAPLNTIPVPELTEEEKALTDAEKLTNAKMLVLGSVYGLNKEAVSNNVHDCVSAIQSDAARQSADASRKVNTLRVLLWTVTITVIVILVATFIILYVSLIFPLGAFLKLIKSNAPLNEKKGLREVRLVASAYNSLLKRRDALDNILRSAAETDALTNLPNRYRFEQYMLESGEKGYSVAVLLFDINYLKRTNDTKGHLAGDQLIRTAAECISSCFGADCFRFGGDEFAAVVKNCDPETIQRMIRKFEETEKRENVSIALGYAYTDEIGGTTVKNLLDEADKKMYEHKKMTHAER